jgi:hypothetical protein
MLGESKAGKLGTLGIGSDSAGGVQLGTLILTTIELGRLGGVGMVEPGTLGIGSDSAGGVQLGTLILTTIELGRSGVGGVGIAGIAGVGKLKTGDSHNGIEGKLQVAFID